MVVHLYGEIIHSLTSFSEWIIVHTGGQTMLYLTCGMIPSIDLARYVIKIWVSEKCATLLHCLS